MSVTSNKRARSDLDSNEVSRPVVKVSQRPPKSCTECIRRKTRCNKQIPCEPCLKRKVDHSCRLEIPYVAASASRSPDPTNVAANESSTSYILAEIKSLRRRISDLEGTSRLSGIALGSGQTATEAVPLIVCQGASRTESSDAGTTLEYLALGMDRRLGNGGLQLPGRPDPRGSGQPPCMINPDSDFAVPESVTDALLPRPTVTAILSYAESHVLWQHCCIHPPSFSMEVETFWDAISGNGSIADLKSQGWGTVEPTWIALLYVVLGISVHQMNAEHATRCGLSEADRLVFPNACVTAAEDALYAGSFMTRPSLWTVQAIAILSLCGHNVCDSDLLSSLLAVGIKMAQSLGLHSLGRRSRAIEAKQGGGADLSGHAEVIEVIDVEIGKRVWWALVLEDWFAIPFRGVWAIHPDQMDTPIPFNCHSEDLQVGRYISRNDDVVTVAQKHRFSSLVATRLQQVFQGLRVPNANALYIVQGATEQIEKLLERLPESLKPLSSSNARAHQYGAPQYIPAMRHYIQISARHKLLVINRAYLASGGPMESRARIHSACVENAKAILQELDRGQKQDSAPMQSLWTIPYHSVAAVVVLALDMMKIGRDNAASQVLRDRQAEIHKATQALQLLAPTSRIARRGLQVLSGLIGEINSASRSQNRRGSKDDVEDMLTKMRLPSNEMIVPNQATESEWSLPAVVERETEISHEMGSEGSRSNTIVGSALAPRYSSSYNVPVFGTQGEGSTDYPRSQSVGLSSIDYSDAAHGPNPDESQWTQEDIDRILSDLQESLPDVGRLFDGSIGMF